MKNKLEDVRNHLFAALEGLADTEKPMEIERAKAISEVAQTIINSAKLELDVVKVYGEQFRTSDFVPLRPVQPAASVQGAPRAQLRSVG